MKKQTFLNRFSSESECEKHLYNIRWPDGCKCPHCKNEKVFLADDGTVECVSCDYKMSLKNGTGLDGNQLELRIWFLAIWYASSVKYPGKITVNKYQRIGEIRSNRPALTIKHAVDSALMNRLVFDKLRGNVEITTIPFRVRGRKLYLITAGEIQKRKVLRIWAEVYTEKPKDTYGFVEKYIDKGAILHYQWGDADESTLQKMGYASGAHRHNYRCATIENESNFLIRQLQSTTKMSEVKKILLRTCAERNSMYIPIAFDDLLKRIIALPSGTKE